MKGLGLVLWAFLSAPLFAETVWLTTALQDLPTQDGLVALRSRAFLSENPEVPWGFNDGALWQGRGLNLSVSSGVAWQSGGFRLVAAPEFVLSQNLGFESVAAGTGDSGWGLDRWQRPSGVPWTSWSPGQSEIRWSDGPWTLGFGTTDLRLGPSRFSPLLLSSNAAGFPHVDLGLSRPWDTPWGSFSGEFLWGRQELTTGTANLYHLLALGYSPPGLPWLTLGAARAFTSPWESADAGRFVATVVPGSLFRAGGADDADQQIAAYGQVELADYGLTLYTEVGRNDAAGDLRDLLLQPDHSLAYTWGFQKALTVAEAQTVTLGYEQTDLGNNIGTTLRSTGSWYRHSPRAGTHEGQLTGAAIGPGSNSQTVQIVYQLGPQWNFTGQWQRIAWDVDKTLAALGSGVSKTDPATINRLDVSLETGLRIQWTSKDWTVAASGSFLKELNRKAIPLSDLTTWRAELEIIRPALF